MAEINPLKGGNRQTWIIAGVAGAGALVYVWWKKKKEAAAASATAGYGYGAAHYGYYSGYGYGSVSPIFGYGQGGFPFLGSYGGPGNYGYQSQFPAPTTNAQWFQEATSWLTQGGVSFPTAEAALGKYLAGAPVDANQTLLIQEAEGALGPPPVSGPSGFPPNINATGQQGGGNAKNPVTGLHQTQRGVTGADIAWNSSSGATSYKVTATKGQATMIGPTSARIHNINTGRDRGDQSTVTVLAEPASQNARAATIVVHTKR